MNRDAILLEKLYALTRADLARASFGQPKIAGFTHGLRFARLRRMSRFWSDDSVPDDALREATADLITGLNVQERSWAWIVRGRARQIECWLGAEFADDRSTMALLNGVFPGVRLLGGVPDLRPLPHALLITGCPSPKTDGHGRPAERIERVIRGLLGREWLYVVHGKPIAGPEVVRRINAATVEIREATSTFALRGSAVDEGDRVATRYIALLERRLRALEEARIVGLWDLSVVLYADHVETLQVARGLMASAMSGSEPSHEPLRCHVCLASADVIVDIDSRTTTDAALFACPSREEFAGYGLDEYAPFSVDLGDETLTPRYEIQIGRVVNQGATGDESCVIERDDLAKHVLVAGVTGSGKTNTCVHLLSQVWQGGRGVPFLVIESAKSEYRRLVREPGFETLTVFTLGNETIAPFRLNLFEVPAGTLVQTHIDYLKALFSAAFVLYPPMPYVLEQSIQETYMDRGWDIARNANRHGTGPLAFPTLSDLAEKVVGVVDRMGYDDRITMDVKAGLLARINQLRFSGGKGLMLDSRDSVSASVLFESPCLLELKEVVSDDEKAFLIGLILIRLCEHCEQRVRSSGLQHLTLIEEAHRLLRNTTTEQGGEVVANPRGRAIEVFANMLSEVRAHGEGILLAEQIPAKLVPDAIKSTNLKVVHRLVASDDRSLLGGAMHLNEAQERRLGLLGTGDAVVFRDGLQNSVMVRVPQSVSSGAAHLSDADLADRMMTQDRYHPVLADRGMACSTCVERGSRTRCGRIPGLVQSAEWTRALRRFLNDLRFLQSSLYESYHALKKTYESRSANRVQPFSCALNLATEAAVIQWGQRCDWNFADTERAVSLVGGAVKEIWDNKDSGSAAQPTESVRRCGEFLASLDADQERPFEACSACQAPCRYRVDVAPLVDRGRAIFQRMFEDKTVNWAGLVAMCRRATAEIVPLAAVGIREGVAMCFAAHQIGSLELTTQTQSELGKRFAIELVKGGSNGSV